MPCYERFFRVFLRQRISARSSQLQSLRVVTCVRLQCIPYALFHGVMKWSNPPWVWLLNDGLE